ncbi:uncharacterized protein LOC131018321 [Salvia miltiorrhiza]|uniref:uncharacterized protein LOC131018321 n=1 Tax=Salvia miltiorrhiza TaxID=226208 RepID=UPI0025AD77B5|nr:uncharacterized protein LOC131018321 [Salvia miltiorrhiza]
MTSNENFDDSSPSFDPFDFTEFDEMHENHVLQNRRIDSMIDDVAFQIPTLSLQPTNNTDRAPRRFIERRREQGHQGVFEQYFSDEPIYTPEVFRKRFRMRKPLFERIMNKLVATDSFFQQKRDATGHLGMSSIQKCTAAMRVLAYGTGADLHDEYIRMSAQTIRKSVEKFVQGVVHNFGGEYLRRPTEEDLACLLYVGAQRGFPGMLGSIDCMHWEWKNCPTAWAGQYTGRSGKTTIILKAVASQDLWIWHAFFGTPGSRNDINVLHQSPVFKDILEGRAPKVSYVVNGHEKDMGYYLTDGIYPSWAAFVKSVNGPQTRKHQLFAQHQEAARKDVERAFGVLQARFNFIKRPCLMWDRDMMGKVMLACIIMHNMIVEDERHTYLNYCDPTEFMEVRRFNSQSEDVEANDDPNFEFSTERIASLASYMRNRTQLRNREAHNALKNDLIEHIWQKFGDDN